MSAVVQSNSSYSSSTTPVFGNTIFPSPVTKGNLLLIVCLNNGADVTVSDVVGNKWTKAIVITTIPVAGFFVSAWWAIANASDSPTIDVTTVAGGNDLHMHGYEIQGYDTPDIASGTTSNPGQTINPLTVSSGRATSRAAEVVLAAFVDIFDTDGGPSQIWTPQVGVEASMTTNGSISYTSLFTEVYEVNMQGILTASTTCASDPESDEQLMVTFYSSSAAQVPGGYWSSGPGRFPVKDTRPVNPLKPLYNAARLRRR